MGLNAYGFRDTSGAGQELMDKLWSVANSTHHALIRAGDYLLLVVIAVLAIGFIAAALMPESRKKIIGGMLCALLGYILLYMAPMIVGLFQHIGNTVKKGGM
ncbi:MAG: hypothetical protein ACPLTR_00935 [Thermacetogeniaceae bacterium]